ncbi:CDC42 small effector protein 2 isoform X2 [Callithrix jacchus]
MGSHLSMRYLSSHNRSAPTHPQLGASTAPQCAPTAPLRADVRGPGRGRTGLPPAPAQVWSPSFRASFPARASARPSGVFSLQRQIPNPRGSKPGGPTACWPTRPSRRYGWGGAWAGAGPQRQLLQLRNGARPFSRFGGARCFSLRPPRARAWAGRGSQEAARAPGSAAAGVGAAGTAEPALRGAVAGAGGGDKDDDRASFECVNF